MNTSYKIIQGDCLEVLPTLDKESVDLVVTSPPYNVGKDYGDKFNDSLNKEDWIKFTKDWMNELHRVVKLDGRIAINVGSYSRNFHWNFNYLIGEIARFLKWRSRGEIIWNHGDLNNRFAWGSFNSPSDPCINIPIEYICIFSKVLLKKRIERKTDLRKREFIEWTNGYWRFPYDKSDHPAAFPEELPRRLIKLLSYVGELVLDPFLGSGTTMKVAQDLGRPCIGIEIKPEYCEMSRARCFSRTFLDREVNYEFSEAVIV